MGAQRRDRLEFENNGTVRNLLVTYTFCYTDPFCSTLHKRDRIRRKYYCNAGVNGLFRNFQLSTILFDCELIYFSPYGFLPRCAKCRYFRKSEKFTPSTLRSGTTHEHRGDAGAWLTGYQTSHVSAIKLHLLYDDIIQAILIASFPSQ